MGHEILTLKEVINAIIEKYAWQNNIRSINIREQWLKMMGKHINNQTEEIFLKKKVLFVKIKSPALKQELSFSKSKMLELLKKQFGDDWVEEIIFL